MAIANKYPTIRPSLNLDFANSKTIDPRITFSRAPSATYFDEKGVMRTAPAGVPRIDFDPVTGECKGLLIEEQRTNLLTYSEQCNTSAWTKARVEVFPNATTAPDGTLTAEKVVSDTTASNTHVLRATSASYTAGITYTLSFYVKPSEVSSVCLQFRSAAFPAAYGVFFDLLTKTVTNNQAPSWITPHVFDVGNGWVRVAITATCTTTYSGNDGFYLYVLNTSNSTTYTGDGTSGLFIWGAQLEAGAFPTSYIKTEASQVTRAADNAVMTGTNFSDWANSVGTVLAKYKTAGWKHNNTPPVTQLDLTKSVDDYSTPITRDGIERLMFYPRQLTESQIAALKG